MDDTPLLSPADLDLEDWCAAVRQTIAPYAATAQGLRPWTTDQRRTLMAAFGDVTRDRDERLAMGNFILRQSGLTRKPFISFAEMSEAQASGLITVLFGPAGDTPPKRMLDESLARLTQVLARVRSVPA